MGVEPTGPCPKRFLSWPHAVFQRRLPSAASHSYDLFVCACRGRWLDGCRFGYIPGYGRFRSTTGDRAASHLFRVSGQFSDLKSNLAACGTLDWSEGVLEHVKLDGFRVSSTPNPHLYASGRGAGCICVVMRKALVNRHLVVGRHAPSPSNNYSEGARQLVKSGSPVNRSTARDFRDAL